MGTFDPQKKKIKPIEIRKSELEERMKQEDTTAALAKAIKSMLNKEKKR